jgi:hypothetical protein
MAQTFNTRPKGSMGNWNTGVDAASLIKPKKQLAMSPAPSPIALPNGRKGTPRGLSANKGVKANRINMTPSGSKP